MTACILCNYLCMTFLQLATLWVRRKPPPPRTQASTPYTTRECCRPGTCLLLPRCTANISSGQQRSTRTNLRDCVGDVGGVQHKHAVIGGDLASRFSSDQGGQASGVGSNRRARQPGE